jgi:hypothetical protein
MCDDSSDSPVDEPAQNGCDAVHLYLERLWYFVTTTTSLLFAIAFLLSVIAPNQSARSTRNPHLITVEKSVEKRLTASSMAF